MRWREARGCLRTITVGGCEHVVGVAFWSYGWWWKMLLGSFLLCEAHALLVVSIRLFGVRNDGSAEEGCCGCALF